jgi:HTH-type transcriptional regulator / antitoxin HigA
MTMDIRPIRTQHDYETALVAVEALFSAQPGTPEGDRLDILTTLIEVYEAETEPIEVPDPIEMIHYIIESRGLSRRDLEPYLGGRARVSEVLNRRRALSLEMIRKLHQGLGIPAEILIQSYPLQQHAA